MLAGLVGHLSGPDVALIGLLVGVIVVSVVGNCLVCVAIFTDRRLRKLGNAFIVSLAIADLFVSCLVMTFALCNDFMEQWIFGNWFCDVWISFDIMCSTASILNLCAISLDRFVHIKDCLLYNRLMTKRVCLGGLLVIWFISALVSFVPINLGWHRPEHQFNFGSMMAGRPPTQLPTANNNNNNIKFDYHPQPPRLEPPPPPAPGSGSDPVTADSSGRRQFNQVQFNPRPRRPSDTPTPPPSPRPLWQELGTQINQTNTPNNNNNNNNNLPQCMLTLTPTYAVISSSISFYIPCIIMLGLYTKLFACARRHVRSIQAQSYATSSLNEPKAHLSPNLQLRSADNIHDEDDTLDTRPRPPAKPKLRLANLCSWRRGRAESRRKEAAQCPLRKLWGATRWAGADCQTAAEIPLHRPTDCDNMNSQFAAPNTANRLAKNKRQHQQRQQQKLNAQFMDNKRNGSGKGNQDAIAGENANENENISAAPVHDAAERQPFIGATQAAQPNQQQQRRQHRHEQVRQTRPLSGAQKPGSSASGTGGPSSTGRPISQQLATHKAAITLGIIMGTFLFCWVPFFCLNIIKAFCVDCIPAPVFKAITWLGYANSALNPIIYGIHNSEFRHAFNRIFFKHLTGLAAASRRASQAPPMPSGRPRSRRGSYFGPSGGGPILVAPAAAPFQVSSGQVPPPIQSSTDSSSCTTSSFKGVSVVGARLAGATGAGSGLDKSQSSCDLTPIQKLCNSPTPNHN